MKKHDYIFTTQARGSYYGIGTYIKQLLADLAKTEYSITIVGLIYKDTEFEILERGSIRYISIPAPVINKNGMNIDAFHQSVPFVLYPYIDQAEHNIFHFNYMESGDIAKYIRLLVGGTIVLTVHYTDWSFLLLGKRHKLLRIQRRGDEEIDLQSQTILGNLEREKDFLKICDKVIAISQHSYRDLIQIHKVDERKITLINNAIRGSCITSKEKRDKARKKFYVAPNEIVLVFVGRLDVVKGIDILINAVKHVMKKYPDLRLVVAGDGDFSKYLSMAFPFWTKITFTGFLSKKSLQELYTIADIGVIPSLHEEFGYVAIEMMSHKIPIIVNNTTGLSEIVDEGINGFKVSVDSNRNTWGSLIDKICFLIENPNIRGQIGQNAYSKFKTYYSIKPFGEKMIDFYASL